ncbi:unnamed protein product, partial [Pylaiella littoralis]
MEEFALMQELDGLFQQDPDIDELGIIFTVPPPKPRPAESNPAEVVGGSSSPPSPPAPSASSASAADATAVAEPQFILQEHKLGVSVHSIHPLINEARAAFPAARRHYRQLKRAHLQQQQQQEQEQQHQQEQEQEERESKFRQEEDGHRDGVDARVETAKRGEGDDRDLEAAAALAAAAERVLSVTRALLLVNADHGSAWNARKEIVTDGLCEGGCSILQEIKLLNLIFTKHAKSPNAWAHRRWCWRNNDDRGINDVSGGDIDDSDNRERILRKKRQRGRRSWQPLDVGGELRVCQRVAELYPKNYYAWTQRSWVVLRVVGGAFEGAGASADADADADAGAGAEGEVVGAGSSTSTTTLAEELLQSEISFVDKWLTSHVSDHSALNHRKNVVSVLVAMLSGANETTTRLDIVEKERSANSKLLRDYPGHESLWCYRRFVCQALLVIAPRHALIGIGTSSASSASTAAGKKVETQPLTQAATANKAATFPLRDTRAVDGPENIGSGLGAGGGGGARGGEGSQGSRSASDDNEDLASTSGATAACDCGYDWAGWGRAVTEWHDGCVREDAKAAAAHEESSEEEGEEEE